MLAPGGTITLQEPNDGRMLDNDGPLPPSVAKFMEAFHKGMRAKGTDPCMGLQLKPTLVESGVFEEINEQVVQIPYSQQTNGAVSSLVLSDICIAEFNRAP